jgi:hypothetical protein
MEYISIVSLLYLIFPYDCIKGDLSQNIFLSEAVLYEVENITNFIFNKV